VNVSIDAAAAALAVAAAVAFALADTQYLSTLSDNMSTVLDPEQHVSDQEMRPSPCTWPKGRRYYLIRGQAAGRIVLPK